MERIIVLLDYNGSALGSVCQREKNVVLLDNSGKMIQEVSEKMTVKEAKDILLRRRMSYVT